MAKRKQKDAGGARLRETTPGELPAVQTATEGAAEANAAGGRSAEESPTSAPPPPASSTPETPAGADAPGSAGRSTTAPADSSGSALAKSEAAMMAREPVGVVDAAPTEATPNVAEATPNVASAASETKAPPAAFNAGAAGWQRYRIHGERGPVVEIARAAGPVYIKSTHGVMLCDEGCLIGRYPERPEELFVVTETDFDAVAYKGKPGISIVDERIGA